METNNTFSFQRLMLLSKQSLIVNKKIIGISLAGFSGILFIALIVLQSAANFKNWENRDSMVTFLFFFVQMGILYAGFSFSAFRTKEKSMTYLMLPASVSEKFVFELLTRIVLFILIMPLLFWMIVNIEGAIVKYYIPELTCYKFSFGETWSEINHQLHNDGWVKFATVQGCLFVFFAVFTGASYFSKSPLLKTLFVFSILVAGYALFTFLLVKGLNLKAFHPARSGVLFMNDKNSVIIFFAILATVINLCLLSIAYFKLKEKEA